MILYGVYLTLSPDSPKLMYKWLTPPENLCFAANILTILKQSMVVTWQPFFGPRGDGCNSFLCTWNYLVICRPTARTPDRLQNKCTWNYLAICQPTARTPDRLQNTCTWNYLAICQPTARTPDRLQNNSMYSKRIATAPLGPRKCLSDHHHGLL